MSQDCKKNYGSGLVFSRIEQFNAMMYSEVVIKHISPNEIICEKHQNGLYGLHTYNSSNKFEVIDVKYKDYNLYGQYKRMLHKFMRCGK